MASNLRKYYWNITVHEGTKPKEKKIITQYIFFNHQTHWFEFKPTFEVRTLGYISRNVQYTQDQEAKTLLYVKSGFTVEKHNQILY